ncbi:hypothetical protein J6590_100006, partial [Homalodisca vitripennis]
HTTIVSVCMTFGTDNEWKMECPCFPVLSDVLSPMFNTRLLLDICELKLHAPNAIL